MNFFHPKHQGEVIVKVSYELSQKLNTDLPISRDMLAILSIKKLITEAHILKGCSQDAIAIAIRI